MGIGIIGNDGFVCIIGDSRFSYGGSDRENGGVCIIGGRLAFVS